jgi:hypothetical protein
VLNCVVYHRHRSYTMQFCGWPGHQNFGSRCQLLPTWARHSWHTQSTTSAPQHSTHQCPTPVCHTAAGVVQQFYPSSTPYPIEIFRNCRTTTTRTIFSKSHLIQNLPPDLPYLSRHSAASGSQLRKSNTSSSKSRARAPQPPSSSTSSSANATLPSTPRHLGKLKGSQRSSNLPPSPNSTRPSHSQDDSVPPTPNQQGKMTQSPAQSTPCPQPRNVRRDPGLINAVWRELQANKSTALQAERLAILEAERRDADLSRAAARLRDVEAATRFRFREAGTTRRRG